MPTTAIDTWGMATRLDPIFKPKNLAVLDVAIGPSLTLARGTVLGELSGTPGTFVAYGSGLTNGAQIPKGLLAYGVSTDASGNVTMIGEHKATVKHAPMYMAGSGAYFKTAELVGLDANAVTVMKASQVSGDLTSGIISI